MTTIYGNAPEGEHYAVLCSAQPEQFPRGPRFIVGFLVTNEDGTEPICNTAGDDQFAVAVCNMVERGTAKAKQFKIRKAMLLPNEYQPIRSATEVPDWQYFIKPCPDGLYRVVRIRVEHEVASKGQILSLVTHIRRPRDGVWQDIRGEFDGRAKRQAKGPVYSWVNPDGSRKQISDSKRKGMSPLERLTYDFWNDSQPLTRAWFDTEGQFIAVLPQEIDKFCMTDRALYDIARLKAQFNVMPVASNAS